MFCFFGNDKRTKPCTRTQFTEWQAQIDVEYKNRQRKKEEEELAKIYSPDEYIDYEKKIIQPYTIIDENDVGYSVNTLKTKWTDIISDSYAVKIDLNKLKDNLEKETLMG